jgi:hypothetical protein
MLDLEGVFGIVTGGRRLATIQKVTVYNLVSVSKGDTGVELIGREVK